MECVDVIIEMTPFIFEDGNTYYFQILKRDSNDYHDIYVYEKIREEKKNIFGRVKVKEYFNQINNRPALSVKYLMILKCLLKEIAH
jgi:hypothetical protein